TVLPPTTLTVAVFVMNPPGWPLLKLALTVTVNLICTLAPAGSGAVAVQGKAVVPLQLKPGAVITVPVLRVVPAGGKVVSLTTNSPVPMSLGPTFFTVSV